MFRASTGLPALHAKDRNVLQFVQYLIVPGLEPHTDEAHVSNGRREFSKYIGLGKDSPAFMPKS